MSLSANGEGLSLGAAQTRARKDCKSLKSDDLSFFHPLPNFFSSTTVAANVYGRQSDYVPKLLDN